MQRKDAPAICRQGVRGGGAERRGQVRAYLCTPGAMRTPGSSSPTRAHTHTHASASSTASSGWAGTGVVDAARQQHAPAVFLCDQAKDDEAPHDQHGHPCAPPSRACPLPEAQRAQAQTRKVAARPREIAVAFPLYAPPCPFPARPQAAGLRVAGRGCGRAALH